MCNNLAYRESCWQRLAHRFPSSVWRMTIMPWSRAVPSVALFNLVRLRGFGECRTAAKSLSLCETHARILHYGPIKRYRVWVDSPLRRRFSIHLRSCYHICLPWSASSSSVLISESNHSFCAHHTELITARCAAIRAYIREAMQTLKIIYELGECLLKWYSILFNRSVSNIST